MRQIEVTTKVEMTMEEVDDLLVNQNFSLIRKSRVEDIYLSQKKIDSENIFDVLSFSVLLRYLKVGEKEFKKITYKNKDYLDNQVISEEKINVNIDDIENAYQIFKNLGFDRVVDVKYDVLVYKRGKLELAFQKVEGLGLLLEVENLEDFTGYKLEDILLVKKHMLDEIHFLGIKTSSDFDIKKAYELIRLKMEQ